MPNFFKRCWQIDGIQRFTVNKGAWFDLIDTFRNDYRLKLITIDKRNGRNCFNTCWYNY